MPTVKFRLGMCHWRGEKKDQGKGGSDNFIYNHIIESVISFCEQK